MICLYNLQVKLPIDLQGLADFAVRSSEASGRTNAFLLSGVMALKYIIIIKMGNLMSYRKDFGLIIVGAVIFTAALLWKDLIVDVREKYFPPHTGLMTRLLFTIMITVILVVVAVEMRNFFGLKPSEVNNNPLGLNDDLIQDETSEDHAE